MELFHHFLDQWLSVVTLYNDYNWDKRGRGYQDWLIHQQLEVEYAQLQG